MNTVTALIVRLVIASFSDHEFFRAFLEGKLHVLEPFRENWIFRLRLASLPRVECWLWPSAKGETVRWQEF